VRAGGGKGARQKHGQRREIRDLMRQLWNSKNREIYA
jgi:hypothetical protein